MEQGYENLVLKLIGATIYGPLAPGLELHCKFVDNLLKKCSVSPDMEKH